MFVTKKFPGRRFNSIEELEELERGQLSACERLDLLIGLLKEAVVVDILVVVGTDTHGETSEKEPLASQSSFERASSETKTQTITLRSRSAS